MPPAVRQSLRALFDRAGPYPLVVFDVDELRVYREANGETEAASCVSRIDALLTERARSAGGLVHTRAVGRCLVVLSQLTYDETVAWAERLVRAVRALQIPFRRPDASSSTSSNGPTWLTVTGAAMVVARAADLAALERRWDERLLEGKRTGGDVLIASRPAAG